MSSAERTGVVISSSRLPRSRSRTSAIAVKITIVMLSITPISPGTTCTAVRRSGLNSLSNSIVGVAREGMPLRPGSGACWIARTAVSTPGRVPSTMTCATGRVPSIRRRSKSGGIYRPACSSPVWISRRSSSTPSGRATNSTTWLEAISATSERDACVRARSTTPARTCRTS